MKHENTGACEKCRNTISTAAPLLRAYALAVQSLYPEAHVSCAFRNQKDQDLAYASKSSRVKWPYSKHNHTPAEALDFFRLKDGVALFESEWFIFVIGRTAKIAGLIWGGDWEKFRDMPHVELP